jgi:hypothetical protein
VLGRLDLQVLRGNGVTPNGISRITSLTARENFNVIGSAAAKNAEFQFSLDKASISAQICSIDASP